MIFKKRISNVQKRIMGAKIKSEDSMEINIEESDNALC